MVSASVAFFWGGHCRRTSPNRRTGDPFLRFVSMVAVRQVPISACGARRPSFWRVEPGFPCGILAKTTLNAMGLHQPEIRGASRSAFQGHQGPIEMLRQPKLSRGAPRCATQGRRKGIEMLCEFRVGRSCPRPGARSDRAQQRCPLTMRNSRVYKSSLCNSRGGFCQ